MYNAIIRQALTVVVTVLVVCSFVGAPAAAALDGESDSGLDLQSSGDSTGDATGDDGNSTDGDDSDGTDSNQSDDESDGSNSDGTDSDDGDDSADDGDGEQNESSDDGTLQSDDSSGDSDEEDDRKTETVNDAVNETVDEVDDAVEAVDGATDDVGATVEGVPAGALDATGDTVEATAEEVSAYVSLEALTGLDLVEFVDPVDAALRAGGPHTYEDDPATALDQPPESSDSGAADSDDDASEGSTTDGEDEDGSGSPVPPAPAGAVVGIGAVAAAAAARESSVAAGTKAARSGWLSTLLDKVKPFVFPLRYSRYDDSDPLEHEARERVYEIVNETPGSYLSEVSEAADLPLSTTRHHVKVLEREDLVTGAKVHGKRRFYPAYAEGIELAAALNDDSTAAIIEAIGTIGAASVSDLADELDRDPSTISHHLQRLEEDGIVTRERDGRAVVNRLTAEARTALEPETAPETDATEAVAGGAD